MWENVKWYLVEVGIKKYGPVAITAAMGALGTFMVAHVGLLEQYGITYGTWPLTWPAGQIPSGPVILVELDTLSAAAYMGLIALAAVIIRAAQHHVSGDTTLPGGMRASDPPKAL